MAGSWQIAPSGVVLRWRDESGWWGPDVAALTERPKPPPRKRRLPPDTVVLPNDLPPTRTLQRPPTRQSLRPGPGSMWWLHLDDTKEQD